MSTNTRKIRDIFTIAGVVALATAALTGCTGGGGEADVAEECVPEHEFETIEAGVLNIGAVDYLPWTAVEGDSVTGVEGDLLTEFAEDNCLTVRISSAGGPSGVIPAIETERTDVAGGGWYRTDDREEIVRMSAPTVLDLTAVVSTEGITSNDLDQGYQVGSSSGQLYNDSVVNWLGDSFVLYQDEEALYNDLAAGRIDAILTTEASAVIRLEENPIENATIEVVTPNENVPEFERPGQIGFPSTLGNDALGEALDATVERMHEDGSLEELIVSYDLSPEILEFDEVWNL